MTTYSEIIKFKLQDKLNDLGLGEIPSWYLKNKMDQVYQDNEVSDKLIATILQLEINSRTLTKLDMEKEAIRSKQAIEQNREDIIKLQIEQVIEKAFPKAKMIKPYDTLHPGFMWRTITEVRKFVNIDDDHNVLPVSTKVEVTHPENMSPLDRLLHDARVSNYTKGNESLEDIVYKVVQNEGTHLFFEP